MIYQDLLDELDILSDDDFRFPEQLIGLMETDSDIDYDIFAELLSTVSPEHFPDMLAAFFDDLIRGIPDDNTELYGAVQTSKEAYVSLADKRSGRGIGFLIDELFEFREWYTAPMSVICIPEGQTEPQHFSPLEAFMLYRQEKMSGQKYVYDFNRSMPPEPGEYIYELLYELGGDWDGGDGEADDLDEWPEELPPDFDPTDYDPDDPMLFGTIDPFRDGYIDRHDPVIEGEGIELSAEYDTEEVY